MAAKAKVSTTGLSKTRIIPHKMMVPERPMISAGTSTI